MTYTIWLYEDRFNALLNKLPDNVKALSREVKPGELPLVKTEVVINDSFDLLQVFHAGMDYSCKYFQK